MIRFDIEKEPPRKSSLPETLWHVFGGFYPFVIPIAWMLLICPFLNLILSDTVFEPHHSPLLEGRWFEDHIYILMVWVWVVGVYPLSLLCSVLYRRQSCDWWDRNAERESFTRYETVKSNLEISDDEEVVGAVRLNAIALGGGCAEDTVIVTSGLLAMLFGLVSVAILGLLFGAQFFDWVPPTSVAWIAFTTVYAICTPPSISSTGVSLMCLWLLFAFKTISHEVSPDSSLSQLIPGWIVPLAAVPFLLSRLRMAFVPRLHWIVFTNRQLLGFALSNPAARQFKEWSEALRSWRALLQQWTKRPTPSYRQSYDWSYGGTMTLTRNRWSGILVISAPHKKSQSMYITRKDAETLFGFIKGRRLPWILGDEREFPRVRRRIRLGQCVNAIVAVVIAFGTGRVCGPLFASALTARYALLPAYEDAQRGDASLYESLLPRVLSARPNDALVWCYRAMSAEKLNRPDDARKSWQRALELTRGQGKIGRTATRRLQGYRNSTRQWNQSQ